MANIELFNPEAEVALLSILIKNPTSFNSLTGVKSFMFSSVPNTNLFALLCELNSQGLVTERSLIINYAKTNGSLVSIGTEQYVDYLLQQGYEEQNLLEYERIVTSSYKARQFISITAEISKSQVTPSNVDLAITTMRQTLDSLESNSGGSLTQDFYTSMRGAWDNIVVRLDNPGHVGYPIGIKDLDMTTGGIPPGELWIIGARPSMGKSALLTNITLGGAKLGTKSLIFSLEMSRQTLVERYITVETGVPLQDIRLGTLTQNQVNIIQDSIKSIRDLPIYIDVSSGVDLQYYISTIRKYKQLHNIDVVHVDYLQLLSGRDEDQTAELGYISKEFKNLAKELNIGIVLYSQLNRLVEMRDNRRPILSDLRQSGNLEEDADLAAFLYRDDYYNPQSQSQGVLEFIIRKNRNGATGTLLFNMKLSTTQITSKN